MVILDPLTAGHAPPLHKNVEFVMPLRKQTLRLRSWDYAGGGWYFITTCTHQGLPFFGKVVDDKVSLSAAGRIAEACWKAIPEHVALAETDAFVAMPNHVHGVLVLDA